MSIMLIRIAILLVIFLGGLFEIIAIAGKEWRKLNSGAGLLKVTLGLWDDCVETKGVSKICSTIKTSDLKKLNLKGELLDVTRAFMIIGLLLYGLAFVLLAMAQFLKKDIFQKLTLPVFFSILSCGIIAMSCYTSFTTDFDDKVMCGNFCPKYGWTYGIGWATVALALIGTTISAIGFLVKSEGTGKY